VQLFETLAELISIPSVTGQEQALAIWCERFLQEAGFQTERQYLEGENRFNLLAEAGEGEQAILLYAHLDTVMPAETWKDPFVLKTEGDRMTGLGVSDMKGGMALILEVAQQFKFQGYRLKIALGVDEELWSEGAWTLVRSGWLEDVALALVPEMSVDTAYPCLGLGRRGSFSYRLVFEGETAHGALFGQGLNAIEEAAKTLQKLPDLLLSRHPEWGAEEMLVRQIQGGQAEFSVPSHCEVVLSCLVHPGTTQEGLQKRLQSFLQVWTQADLCVSPLDRPTPMAPGYWVSPYHPLVKQIQDLFTRLRGQALPEVMGVSVADENILALVGFPVLSLAPVGGNSHRPDEWLSRESLLDTYRLYQEILRRGAQLLSPH